MTTMTQFQDRAYRDADLQAVCDLLNQIDAVDHLDDNYAVEDLRIEFEEPQLNKARDLRLWEDRTGRLVAFGQTHVRSEGDTVDVGFYFRIHPDVRGSEIEDAIMEWGIGRCAEAGRENGKPVQVNSWTEESHAYAQEILKRHAFAPVRYFFRMARPLDAPIPEPVFPVGFTLRHVSSAADVEGWVGAFNQSFIDHWNHHPVTVENHQHWLQHPNYQPERDLIAVAADGTIAAFCFCMIDPASNARNGRSEGWIDILGTRRGYRKIGLGRAMLLAGLQRLKADGMDTAVLGVDADNPTGALGLYESVGFTPVKRSVTYRKALA